MTQAPERETARSTTTPQERVDAWLARFEAALRERDALFLRNA